MTFGYILYAKYRKKSIEIPKGYFFRVIPSTQFSDRWMGNPGFWGKGVVHGLLFSAQAIFLLPHRDDYSMLNVMNQQNETIKLLNN